VTIQNTSQADGGGEPAGIDGGYAMTSTLWAKTILQPSTGPVTLIWKKVGMDITPSGDQVVSGYFYADPKDFAYGSQYNPEIFVKIYIAKNGWCNIAFNHVTVDNVSLFSAHNYAGSPNQSGTAGLASRLVEDQYDNVIIDGETDVTATDPVLYFSDITSAPKSGNSDTSGGRSGIDGAIVTLWGSNLGNARGSSQVYINGAEAASYYTWGNATGHANLGTYHQMQMVSFQISHLAQEGAGQIYVVVNEKQSNSLPFTVRPGNIYFALITGSDDTGDGSWGKPWRTIPFAAGNLTPGDIAYIGNGVDQTTETDFSAAVNLGSDGTDGNPMALIVYPGATSKVGNASIERAFWMWNGNTSGYSTHWTIAKFTITTGQVGIPAQTGFRVIGNYVTAPQGDGMDGAIDVTGNNVFILGNELENVGSATCSKLYHGIYVKGVRQDSPPRAPTESDREVAWNYVHDGLCNRAINIYSEQDYSAYIRHHRVHDNVIVNQRGDGIMLGYYVIGDNWIYNNLIVNAGLGPEWSDDNSYHTGLRINTGHEQIAQTAVYLYHNTLYGNGWAGAALPEETGSLLVDPGALERGTTVYFSNNIVYSTGEPYLAGESAALPAGDYRNCWFNGGIAPEWDTTAITGDPDFVNTGTSNFQLKNGSPCVDAGKNVSAPVQRDMVGVPRPQGLACDIGAYEYLSAPAAPVSSLRVFARPISSARQAPTPQ
jgi:hypothetical protein